MSAISEARKKAGAKPPVFKVGQKVLLDGVVTKAEGEKVTVQLNIETTPADLLDFDQSTTSILD